MVLGKEEVIQEEKSCQATPEQGKSLDTDQTSSPAAGGNILHGWDGHSGAVVGCSGVAMPATLHPWDGGDHPGSFGRSWRMGGRRCPF